MVILRKDFETKEIEIPGFRKILKDTKNPDYKELRIYIKKGWIPVDEEDNKKEQIKANKKKDYARKMKAKRPKYDVMERKLKELTKDNEKEQKKIIDDFEKQKAKKDYMIVLKWYKEVVEGLDDNKSKSNESEKEVKINSK